MLLQSRSFLENSFTDDPLFGSFGTASRQRSTEPGAPISNYKSVQLAAPIVRAMRQVRNQSF